MVAVALEENEIKNKINLEMLKNNPKLILFLRELKRCKIDIDSLTRNELNKIFECMLIIIR